VGRVWSCENLKSASRPCYRRGEHRPEPHALGRGRARRPEVDLHQDIEACHERFRRHHNSGEKPEMLAQVAEGLVQQFPQAQGNQVYGGNANLV